MTALPGPGGAHREAAGAGVLRDIDTEGVLNGADFLLNRKRYSEYMELLEGQPRDVLANTTMAEYLVLKLVKDMRLRHRSDREFESEIRPYEPRILGIMRSVLEAKSLDAEIDSSKSKYHSLMDYVSRVSRGHKSMLDHCEFWPWLDGDYGHVARLLRADGGGVSKTNSLAQALSMMFKCRETPRVKAHMGAIDHLCRRAMEICASGAHAYAKKSGESWDSARMEMAALVAVGRHFKIGCIDPEIPGSKKQADISFVHNGVEHYVEVYSHAGYYSAVPQIKLDISSEEEWAMRFGKSQIEALREAGVPTVYVMNLDDFQARPGETGSPEFREAAARLMPPDSDIVVILHGAEAASLRGGRVVEPSDVAVRLRGAIWEAMPENAPGLSR